MFERFKRDIRAHKFFSTAEEAIFFEQAAKEVAAGEIQAGLHAMALSKCEGDEAKANAMYLQLRVNMLKQEAAVGEKILEAAEREQAQLDQEQKLRDEQVAMEEARRAGFSYSSLGSLSPSLLRYH